MRKLHELGDFFPVKSGKALIDQGFYCILGGFLFFGNIAEAHHAQVIAVLSQKIIPCGQYVALLEGFGRRAGKEGDIGIAR